MSLDKDGTDKQTDDGTIDWR